MFQSHLLFTFLDPDLEPAFSSKIRSLVLFVEIWYLETTICVHWVTFAAVLLLFLCPFHWAVPGDTHYFKRKKSMSSY